jgi:predicted nuclease with RNAse H fold/adenylate kinase family enzyme
LLGSVLNEALYLDIETTGLSRDLHYITVIGALWEGKFHQWVWPEPLEGLASLLRSAPVVVTFNGRRFDVPFLAAKTPQLPEPKAHIDLLHIAREAGFQGGQKSVEIQTGLARDAEIEGLDGPAAVVSWCSALYGDRASYRRLLRYNQADVEMMPQIARRLCARLVEQTAGMPAARLPCPAVLSGSGNRAAAFAALQREWRERRPALGSLEARLSARFGRVPVVVGIDLRAKAANPTGWALCQGARAETRVVHTDEEILELTFAARPDLVSIDAPLSLPRGRYSVSDDSPCRAKGGIVRDAERILRARGIRVYPALIRQMQGLTQRGIDLTRQLESRGIRVIESYPGAAQDILNIPRKRIDESLLRLGLAQFGYQFRGPKTHDELDAITSAMVGQFYLADEYERIGADDEGFMIVPKWPAMTWATGGAAHTRRTVSMVGLPGAGKTTRTRAIAQRPGWRWFILGDAIRERAKGQPALRKSLAQGEFAPEALVQDLVRRVAGETTEPGLIVDGFPRHRRQLQVAAELFDDWTVIHLDVDPAMAALRLAGRVTCGNCGYVSSAENSGNKCPGCRLMQWRHRSEDAEVVSRHRVHRFGAALRELLDGIPERSVVRVSAAHPIENVADDVLAEILTTRVL